MRYLVFSFVFLLFSLLLVVIISELFSLQVINNEENALQIENQNFEVFYIPAPRGEIFDINGNKLAASDLEPYLYLFLFQPMMKKQQVYSKPLRAPLHWMLFCELRTLIYWEKYLQIVSLL